MSETATALASVADSGAGDASLAATPTAELETTIGAPEGAETASPEAGADQKPEAGSEADKPADQQPVEGEDGRAIPKQWRELFQKDHELKRLFFADRELKKVVPEGVAGVREMKERFDLLGGREGIETMQTDLADFKEVAKQFIDGDPAFIDDLAGEDPEAFSAHVPRMLEKYREINPDGFARELCRQISAEHQAVGFRAAIEDAYSKIPQGQEGDAARAVLKNIADWHDRIESRSKQEDSPEVKELRTRLQRERTERERGDTEKLNREYHSEIQRGVESSANRMLDSYFRQFKLDADDRKDVLDAVIRRASRTVLSDADFIKQRDLLNKRMDKNASVRFVTRRFENALQDAVAREVRRFSRGAAPNGGGRPATTSANNNGGARPVATASGFTLVKEMPKAHEIDRLQTTPQMVGQHRAILKDGRKVQWTLG